MPTVPHLTDVQRWHLTVGTHDNGRPRSAIVYPGGVPYEHAALPITAGVRYMPGGALD